MEPYSSDDIKRKKRRNYPPFYKLFGAIPEIKAAAIVSTEGIPIAFALPEGVDEIKIAAMTAALLSLAEKAIIEINKGDFDQLYIKGSEGYLLVMQVSLNAVLIVSATKDVGYGLIYFINKIVQMMHGDFDDDDDKYPYF